MSEAAEFVDAAADEIDELRAQLESQRELCRELIKANGNLGAALENFLD